MPGRHSLNSDAALSALNSPMGRSAAAALVAGTILGVVLPSANAAEDSATNSLAPVTEAAVQEETATATSGISSVTSSADATWQLEQVSDSSGIQVDAQTQADLAKEATQAEAAAKKAEEAKASTTSDSKSSSSSSSASSEVQVAASSSSTGSDVLATAMKYIGSPYMWGGTTPSGWDCIGFVRYVYAKHGVQIAGYTSSVLNVGTRVSYSEAQPGDILYWPGHVAIYAGGGKNVGAWNESMGTRVGANSLIGGTPIVIRVLG